MNFSNLSLLRAFTLGATLTLACAAEAQPFAGAPRGGGFGFGPGGPGGGGGPGQLQVKVLDQFDKNNDGWLNAAERNSAREFLQTQPRRGRGGGRGGISAGPPAAGPSVKLADAKKYDASTKFYDPAALRTIFLEFEEPDWERELADFYHSDVKVPAKMTVDGTVYPNTGIDFRGSSSYSSIPEGYKRSFSISTNEIEKAQTLYGFSSLNLLNAHQDPTFMRSYLYYYVARQYVAAPKANFVRLVVNGESWGIYVNVEQINGDMLKENFPAVKGKGTHWKIPGRPGAGRAGLSYLGDDPEAYKSSYEMKGKENPQAWVDLAHLTKVLNQTPPDQLEKALEGILDVDGALRFLALDKTLINNDGYWTRASDYGLYEETGGLFHVLPWDANETWQGVESGRGGGGGVGVALDPFAGSTSPQMALLNKLLAVPSLRERYLGYIRDIAENWLVWSKIGPLVEKEQALIAADVKADTHKLYSTAAFTSAVTTDGSNPGVGMAPPDYSLKSFVEERHDYLLNYPDIKKLPKSPPVPARSL